MERNTFLHNRHPENLELPHLLNLQSTTECVHVLAEGGVELKDTASIFPGENMINNTTKRLFRFNSGYLLQFNFITHKKYTALTSSL